LNDCFGELDLYDAFIVERDLNTKSSYLTSQFEVLHCMKLDDDDSEILHAQPRRFGSVHRRISRRPLVQVHKSLYFFLQRKEYGVNTGVKHNLLYLFSANFFS